MSDTYLIELSHLETLFLSDSLSMFTQGPPGSLGASIDQLSPYPTLLLKIGGAILETEQTKAATKVSMTIAELWMIREVAKSSVVVGSERVGLNLLIKVYEALRTLSAEPNMQSVVNDIGEVLENEPGKRNYAAQLERIRSGEELEIGGSGDDDVTRDDSRSGEKSGSDHDAATAA